MSWLTDGIEIGDKWDKEYKQDKRQKVEDAYTEETRNRKRIEQADADNAKAVAGSAMADEMERRRQDGYTPQSGSDLVGYKRLIKTPGGLVPVTDAVASASRSDGTQGEQAAQASPQAMPGAAPVAPVADTPEATPTSDFYARAQATLMDRMKVAHAGNDRAAFYAANDQLSKLRQTNEEASISSFIHGASAEQLHDLMGKVSNDPRNPFKYSVGADGKTTGGITEGATPIPLTRDDLANYFVGQHRLNRYGDVSGNDLIAKVGASQLAEQARTMSIAEKQSKANYERLHGNSFSENNATKIDLASQRLQHQTELAALKAGAQGGGLTMEGLNAANKRILENLFQNIGPSKEDQPDVVNAKSALVQEYSAQAMSIFRMNANRESYITPEEAVTAHMLLTAKKNVTRNTATGQVFVNIGARDVLVGFGATKKPVPAATQEPKAK